MGCYDSCFVSVGVVGVSCVSISSVEFVLSGLSDDVSGFTGILAGEFD